jgi:hypothetical protein
MRMSEWSEKNLALLEEGQAIVEWGTQEGLAIRLLGGAAILLHCEESLAHQGFRELADIDVVVSKGEGRALSALLVEHGYEPERRFNALHGQTRMLFHGKHCHVDVLIGAFEMCHRIDFSSRTSLDYPTLPVTDLLMTKLQIVELNEKDANDAILILTEHETGLDDGDVVNVAYVCALVSNDWGLWRTVTGTLERLEKMVPKDEPAALRIRAMQEALVATPKTLKWRTRARVGERKRWYLVPDEVSQ